MRATTYGCEMVCRSRSAARCPRRRGWRAPPRRTGGAAPRPSRRARARRRCPCSRRRSTMRARVRCEVMPMPARVPHRRQPFLAPARAGALCVRSIRSGVTETRRASTAWKSVPGPASCGAAGRPDPVGGLAARRLQLHHRLGLVALAQARHLDAAQLGRRQVGHVDVEQHRLARAARGEALDQLERDAARCRNARPPCGQRDRDRRDAEQVAFGGGGHGAGVDRVVAHVGAEVDARDDHVGREVEQPGDREVHAVGRRAVDGEVAVRRAAHRQRPVERERVRGAGAVALGRDHGDLAQLAQRLGEQRDARREVAVVVGHQDAHRRILRYALFRRALPRRIGGRWRRTGRAPP